MHQNACWNYMFLINPSSLYIVYSLHYIKYFIMLIHLTGQLLILPVPASLAKCQKKLSSVSTGETDQVATIRQVACSTSFLAREHDIIVSLSFGACAVQTHF